jgi:ribosomal-protein-alanine N-acetyltransferase
MTHGPVFDSDRFVYRPLTLTDDGLIRAMFMDADIARYVGGVQPPEAFSVPAMATYCRRALCGGIGVWIVVDKRTREDLGTAILLPLPIDAPDTEWHRVVGDGYPAGPIEIGYVLKRTAWGRGVATEACARLLRFAFEDTPLREVVACTDPDNAASQRVLTKAGLRREGWHRCYGGLAPFFRITRGQWLADRAGS